MSTTNQRPVEASIVSDFSNRLSYSGYLSLEGLLAQQHPLSRPEHHDELLFIIQHQVSELWMKLLIHELTSAIDHLQPRSSAADAEDSLAREAHPDAALRAVGCTRNTHALGVRCSFGGVLGNASGFQSFQYRTDRVPARQQAALRLIDVLRTITRRFTRDLDADRCTAPSLYDEFLRHLARRGHASPCGVRSSATGRSRTRATTTLVRGLSRSIYADTRKRWEAYEMCEKLVDVEEYLPALALPASQDRRADHRLPARHRRVLRRELPSPGTRPDVFPELLTSRTEAPKE